MSFVPLSEADPAPFRICFVCSGNICRSPMAEIVMRSIADASGLGPQIATSSAGTGDWHVGEPADPRDRRGTRRGRHGRQPAPRATVRDGLVRRPRPGDRARPQP